MYNKLVAKLMQLTLVDLMKKQVDDAGKKMPDASGLVKKKGHNAKITAVECKIPSITYWFSHYQCP